MAGRRILIPKEHGAWAMLLMAYVVGVGAAGRLSPEAGVFLVAAIFSFAGRCPLALAIKRRSNVHDGESNIGWIVAYLTLVAAAGVVLLLVYERWALVPLGAFALILIALEPVVRRNRLERTVRGELLAFAGLALTAPGAYYASTGLIDRTAAMVWLLTFLYAGASVFYVKLKVKQRVLRAAVLAPTQRWLLGRDLALYHATLLAIVVFLALAGLIPWLALLAFVPLTYKVGRDIWRIAPELNLRHLGFVEVGHSVAFCGTLITAYLFG